MNWYKKAQADYRIQDALKGVISPQEISNYKRLKEIIDQAYETNQFEKAMQLESELENLTEELTNKAEAIITEGYGIEGGGEDTREEASLEELLANLYYQYINFKPGYGPFSLKEDILNNMRSGIITFRGNPNISNETILDAAQDAFIRRKKLIKKHKQYIK